MLLTVLYFEAWNFKEFAAKEKLEIVQSERVASPLEADRYGERNSPHTPFRLPRLEAERKDKPPKNLKKCRLKLYFDQKRAFFYFDFSFLMFSFVISIAFPLIKATEIFL